MILLLFAFLSGIVTILSPCILPVLPIVLSGSVGGKKRPFGVISGFIASFSVFTLLLSTLVRILNIPPDSLRIVAVVLIMGFGLVMIIPKLKHQFELFISKITSRKQKTNKSAGFTGGFLTGISLGLVWTPCVGPIMASVISLAITQSVDSGTILIILTYSLGTSIPMFGIMFGGRKLIKRFPVLSKNPERIQKLFGVLMIVVGLSIATGMDRKFQTAILNVFPNYGSGLTAFENLDAVNEAINERNPKQTLLMTSGNTPVSFNQEPKNGRLDNFGKAPELITRGEWFNTDKLDIENKPVSMEDLKGKVVLLDFWTYSCINCIRTIPHLKALYDTYGGDNFVIIGIHTPEFTFERDPGNVQKAMKDLGVNWPVLLDNDYKQWKAYNNRYWPAHYFIDAAGNIRYFHFGEGEYDTAENVVRALLKEAGNLESSHSGRVDKADIRSKTNEIYLGYNRSEGFISEEKLLHNQFSSYSPAKSHKNGEWSLRGDWIITGDYISSHNSGELELGFNAKNIYLVIEPMSENEWLEVMIDNKKVKDSRDVKDGVLKLDESRVYQLGELKKPGKHNIKLIIHGEPRLFAFTFG